MSEARAVPLLVGLGDADTTVDPVMADRLVAQFAAIDTATGSAVGEAPARVRPPTTPVPIRP